MNNGKELILVVGGSSDIGLEIIRQIASEKTVILAHGSGTEKVKEHTQGLKGEIIPLSADLTDLQATERLIDAVKAHGVPDKIAFLAAPKMAYVRFKDLSWDEVQKNLDVQVRSTFLILKAFLPAMAQQGGGRVLLLLSSVVLNVPPKALLHYTASKYALLGLMKALASEYADKGVRINAISPSMTETAFLQNVPEKLVELAAQAHPLKRNAVPSDIAPLARYLLSDEAAYVNGVNIPVCGGSAF